MLAPTAIEAVELPKNGLAVATRTLNAKNAQFFLIVCRI
jgi:hypothetical protein